jgi:hypothetical protein
MANDAQVELILWARGDIVTYLELEPFAGALRPIRMPILESIRPYPDDAFGVDENDHTGIARLRVPLINEHDNTDTQLSIGMFVVPLN